MDTHSQINGSFLLPYLTRCIHSHHHNLVQFASRRTTRKCSEIKTMIQPGKKRSTKQHPLTTSLRSPPLCCGSNSYVGSPPRLQLQSSLFCDKLQLPERDSCRTNLIASSSSSSSSKSPSSSSSSTSSSSSSLSSSSSSNTSF
jgi:hypothetical protein